MSGDEVGSTSKGARKGALALLSRLSAIFWTLSGFLGALVCSRLLLFAWAQVSAAQADVPAPMLTTPLEEPGGSAVPNRAQPSGTTEQLIPAVRAASQAEPIPKELEQILNGGASLGASLDGQRGATASAAVASRRIMLVVSGEAERADVFVNEQRVGQLPFLGGITCKTGQPVIVKVVPRRGPAWTRHMTCRGETMRVSE